MTFRAKNTAMPGKEIAKNSTVSRKMSPPEVKSPATCSRARKPPIAITGVITIHSTPTARMTVRSPEDSLRPMELEMSTVVPMLTIRMTPSRTFSTVVGVDDARHEA